MRLRLRCRTAACASTSDSTCADTGAHPGSATSSLRGQGIALGARPVAGHFRRVAHRKNAVDARQAENAADWPRAIDDLQLEAELTRLVADLDQAAKAG